MALTPAEKSLAARRAEIQDLLGKAKVEMDVPAWCVLAFEQSEIEGIALYRSADNTFTKKSRVDTIGRGHELGEISTYVLEKHGPGYYLFQPFLVGGRWSGGAKIEGLGVVEKDVPLPLRPHSDDPEVAVDLLLKKTIARKQLLSIMSDMDQADMTRQVAPIQVFSEMAKLLRPADGASSEINKLLMAQVAELQRTLFELLRSQNTQKPEAVADSMKVLDSVMSVAQKIGWAPGEGSPAPGYSMAEVIREALPVAVPLIRDALDTLKVAVAGRAASRAPAPVAAGPSLTGGEGGDPMAATMKPEDKELVEIGYNALKSKDYPTFLATYEAVRPMTMGVLPELNPEVNPALYIAVLKRFDARFDLLRAEMASFLGWLREQEAEADARQPTPPE